MQPVAGRLDEPRVSTTRIAVPADPLLARRDADYADAYEAHARVPDDRPVESWVRAALDGAPRWMRVVIVVAHRGVLRFRAAPPGSPQALGLLVTLAEHDVVRLETEGPLLKAVLIARRTAPTVATVATHLWFRHRAARVLWTALGPVHRAFVPRLLRHAAAGAGAG